ncbi:MAG: tRNA lysidine(34) synthetase TilS [Janthinobacterium lividum]
MGLQFAFDNALNKLGPFESHPHLALAVSGGSDSIALAFLCQSWCARYQGQMTCLIVDHGLRTGSTQEALNVQQQLKDHQISCEILTWTGIKPKNRLQEQARRARYTLLEEWCHQHHILNLLTGHHQDDQRETYQLRQDKNSGSLGLSGMSALIETPHVKILRPLLHFSKMQLRTFLNRQHISFVEDPSNINPKFTRSVLRQHSLNDQDKAQIHQSCRQYGQARVQTEKQINKLVSCWVSLYPEGYGTIDQTGYQNMTEEDQMSVLQRCLMTFGIGSYTPACDSLKSLTQHLKQIPFVPQTLHGCIIFYHKKQIYITREPGQIKPVSLSHSSGTLWWDERFQIEFSNVKCGDILAPLGAQGWSQLKQKIEFKFRIKNLKTLPAFVRFGLPSLWRGGICLNLWLPDQNYVLMKINKDLYSEFTTEQVYDIHFSPRYPLTRFTFVIV